MKCIRCGRDAPYSQRQGRICVYCGRAFAFEPRQGDPVTDMLFKNAIAAVSGPGQVRFGIEHLYYEVCRRKRRRVFPWGFNMALIACVVGGLVGWFFNPERFWPIEIAGVASFFGLISLYIRSGAQYVTISPDRFRSLYDRWCHVHGVPEGVIQRREQPPSTLHAEPDLGDYAFDRAVICDRARTVDLLLANNFHFENNCAILSSDGYPPGPFATVRAMLLRNPNLQAFVLHDATPEGCRLARRLIGERDWFPTGVQIIDVGIRPAQAQQFFGLWQRTAGGSIAVGNGLTAYEARWLSQARLELAVVRPAQIIKRLFRAVNRQSLLQNREREANDEVLIFHDRDDKSFTTDADAIDTSADAFG